MNFHHLRHFVAVAEELHFGRAAERLGMAQPPLSQSIRRLEDSLGCQLFRRTRKSIELTAAGVTLLQHARDIIGYVKYAETATIAASKLGVSKVRIGFTPNALSEAVPRAMQLIKQTSPLIDIVLMEGSAGDHMASLATGEVDIAFIPEPGEEHKELEARIIERTSYIAAVHETSPLAALPELRLADFADQQILFFPAHHRPDFHAAVTYAFRNAGVNFQVAQEAAFDHTRLKMVAAGMGVSLINEAAAPSGYPRVALRRFVDMPPTITLNLAVIWRKAASPAARKLFEAIYAAVRHDR